MFERGLDIKSIGLSKQECIEKLLSYKEDIEKIVLLFKDKYFLGGADKKLVQELLKNLKQNLKNDWKLRDTERGRKQMSSVEEAYYSHAIRLAYVNHIKRIESNSTPNDRWLLELGGAELEIEYWLNELSE